MVSSKSKWRYLLLGLGFFFMWFPFKFGGMPDIKKAIFSTAIDVLPSMAAMILTVELLLPVFFYRLRYKQFSLLLVILVLLAGSAIILSQLALMESSLFAYQKNIARYHEHFFYWFWSDLIFGSYFLVTFLCLTGMVVRMAFDRINADCHLQMLEKEKAMSELLVLKHQINPHFIFNMLNTVYYKIDKANAEARQILEQFSSLLRYQLYESDDPIVSVESELGFLCSYINVQKQRLNPACVVTVEGFEALKGFKIAPNLLLPLVENCFKHVSNLDDGSSCIRIRAQAGTSTFEFETENSVKGYEASDNRGIGVDNLKRRLELLYPGKYTYKSVREEHKFSTFLSITIV